MSGIPLVFQRALLVMAGGVLSFLALRVWCHAEELQCLKATVDGHVLYQRERDEELRVEVREMRADIKRLLAREQPGK